MPTALALLAELGLPVAPLAERVGHALDLLRDPARTPSLAPADRSLLQETLSRLAGRAATGGPQQILHGEPHPGNLLDTPAGPRFIDLETFCRGPVEFDLTHAPAEAAAQHPGHDPALLEECRTLSLALATTWRWGPGGHLPGRPSDRRGVAGRGAGSRRGMRPRDRGPSSRIPCPGMVGASSPSSRRILR